MTTIKLHLLLALLKIYRAHFCFGGDAYEKHASAVIHDVRIAIANGGLYYIDRKMVRP